MPNPSAALRKIRILILLFIFGLVVSGATAFPLQTEILWLNEHRSFLPMALQNWVQRVASGIDQTWKQFPFIAYGTDWLAFAHLVIAMAFIGPYRDPVKNKWVIDWAILCCIAIIPLALIAGPVRDIPWFHQLIDISFGLIGILPLLLVRKLVKKLEAIN